MSAKHQKAEEEEMKRHNAEMEKLAQKAKTVTIGAGLKKKEKIEPLSKYDIIKLAKDLKIKHFRDVFMKDALPQKSNKIECGIINLENTDQSGSHWVAYYKNNDKKFYFDSYGNASPPKEIVKYLGPENLFYNSKRFQNYNDPLICGHLCLIVLKKLSKNENYEYILRNLDKSEFKSI